MIVVLLLRLTNESLSSLAQAKTQQSYIDALRNFSLSNEEAEAKLIGTIQDDITRSMKLFSLDEEKISDVDFLQVKDDYFSALRLRRIEEREAKQYFVDALIQKISLLTPDLFSQRFQYKAIYAMCQLGVSRDDALTAIKTIRNNIKKQPSNFTSMVLGTLGEIAALCGYTWLLVL